MLRVAPRKGDARTPTLTRYPNPRPEPEPEGTRTLRTTDLGDSLLFFPLHPDGSADHDAVHGGCAVRGPDDVKWIAQQWFTRSSGEAAG